MVPGEKPEMEEPLSVPVGGVNAFVVSAEPSTVRLVKLLGFETETAAAICFRLPAFPMLTVSSPPPVMVTGLVLERRLTVSPPALGLTTILLTAESAKVKVDAP